LGDYYNRRLGTMAQRRIDQGDNLMVVNMESGAGLNYSRDLVDGIHPTNCGYEKMANLWYEALTGEDAPALTSCH
jgi:lysophospholipase L1-like esterase